MKEAGLTNSNGVETNAIEYDFLCGMMQRRRRPHHSIGIGKG